MAAGAKPNVIISAARTPVTTLKSGFLRPCAP